MGGLEQFVPLYTFSHPNPTTSFVPPGIPPSIPPSISQSIPTGIPPAHVVPIYLGGVGCGTAGMDEGGRIQIEGAEKNGTTGVGIIVEGLDAEGGEAKERDE